jgi:hypothetical protein
MLQLLHDVIWKFTDVELMMALAPLLYLFEKMGFAFHTSLIIYERLLLLVRFPPYKE